MWQRPEPDTEQDKARRPECTKRHVQPHNLIWYPICWVTHTPHLPLFLLRPPWSIRSCISLSAPCFSFLEHHALANFLRVYRGGNFSLKYAAYLAACISSCVCVCVQLWLAVFLALPGSDFDSLCVLQTGLQTHCWLWEGENSIHGFRIMSAKLFKSTSLIKIIGVAI